MRKRRAEQDVEPAVAKKANREEFERLHYLGEFYKIGDSIQINADPQAAKGKITQILMINAQDKGSATAHVLVNWYYTKHDIHIQEEDLKCISEAEIFESNHSQEIDVATILGKIEVMDIERYTQLPEQEDNAYFTRGKYNYKSKKISPSMDTWKTLCTCQRPENPDDMVVCCENWQQWFHPTCQGMEDSEAEQLEKFYCNKCKQ